MGERMRSFQWSGTSLGDPASWPQSLKTIVRVMLDSRFAMWMAWGEDGIFFCNDAYLPTVGIKRDWVLGARADRVWAEIWPDIGPRIAHVLSTGEATWDEGLQLFLQRSGFVEETFHTFSYSSVYDDGNRIVGMLCVVAEETARVIGQRRLGLLRNLAATAAGDAASVAEAGNRLLTALAHGTEDVPFGMLYLSQPGDDSARLSGWTRAPLECPAPAQAQLEGDSAWKIGDAIIGGQEQFIHDFAGRCSRINGAWGEEVQQALVFPLLGAGQPRPMGALVLGASTRQRLDESYRSFLSLVAAQVASRLADTQAQLQARQRAEALAELDRAKNTFFSNVSHEFRTPLTLMLGPLESLLEQPELTDEARAALRLVHRNGLRMRKLVNSLLDFSRIEAGRVDASYRATDLAALTRDLASVFRSAVETAGLRLSIECDDLGEPVYVDRDMWEKVVLNLLSNAFKFTFEGEIAVSLALAGAEVELVVRDSGIGIDADDLAQIFDRFHRVAGARSRSQEGTGIGLALVKELARLHGGTVHAHSTIGEGTRFVVRLPRGLQHLPAERIEAATSLERTVADPSAYLDDSLRAGLAEPRNTEAAVAAAAAAPASALARARVLVADDNADMRAYLEKLLSPRWDVVTAVDGMQALQLIEREPPDLLLTDVMMPKLDGFGLLERLRAQDQTRQLPVIVLSAQAGEEARLSGLSRGADDYLVKPFSARELVARIEVQMMRAQLRKMEQTLDRRLAEVFRNAPVSMALLRGPQHVFEFANAEYRAMLGNRELIGLPIRQALPELEGQSVLDMLDGVRWSGEPRIGRAFPVSLFDPVSGTEQQRFFDFVYQPIGREAGADGIAVVSFDVTSLMLARKDAEAASRAKDEFIAMLGHELRNPLAPIVTTLQLMKMQWPGHAEREHGIIGRQLHHMIRLVDDLLDISRITRGTIDLKKGTVELATVVAKAVETAAPLFEQKRLNVTVEVPPQGLELHIDAVRVAQVVANLLTNAAKFTPPGKAVTMHGRREDDEVVLEVRDEGIGITPQDLSGIFDIFMQGRQSMERSRGGLGLGLAISRSLTGMHGGTLTADSPGENQGSTFTLRLPQHLPPHAAPEPAVIPPADGVEGRNRLALIVDDNVDAAESLSAMLQMWGYRTKVAHDASTGLQLCQEHAFDLALLDIGLPVMNGYELAERLRATDAGKRLWLIALTGYGQASDRERSRRSGFDHHLVKPVDIDRLAQLLRQDQRAAASPA